MQLIADTNIFLAIALEEPEKADIVRLTCGAEIAAPEILPYEIGNALSAMFKRGRITAEQVLAVRGVTEQVPVRLLPVDVGKALEIALTFNIYAYDAYFLQCARTLGCPLMTLDRRMQSVASELEIEHMELLQ